MDKEFRTFLVKELKNNNISLKEFKGRLWEFDEVVYTDEEIQAIIDNPKYN